MGPIQLVLDPNEATIVDDALTRILHTLRVELTRTEDRELRGNLSRQIDALEAISQRLGRARAAA